VFAQARIGEIQLRIKSGETGDWDVVAGFDRQGFFKLSLDRKPCVAAVLFRKGGFFTRGAEHPFQQHESDVSGSEVVRPKILSILCWLL